LTVESARSQQGFIEYIGTVGCRYDDDAFIAVKAVHFYKQLVQGLFALVVAAAHAVAAMATDRIDLVDEDDARRAFLGLFEHVANARGADTDEHFDEIRTGYREERHTRFACNGPSQQRFTGSRRTDHQYAARYLAAEEFVFGGVSQKIDHFDDVFLGFFDAGDIGEFDFDLVFLEQFGLAFTEIHLAAHAAALLFAEEINPDCDQQ